VIELRGLAKKFGPFTALASVDTTISGRIIGLLGPKGAG